jgi:CubicO group peptidase (beta-lactamase class C family)
MPARWTSDTLSEMMYDGQDIDIDVTTIASALPDLLQRTHVPGLSLALVQDAAVVWTAACGRAHLQPPRDVTPDTVFQAASLSKPLFAYAVLGLVRCGHLDLDAPLTAYLPDAYVPDDPLLPAITARRVLCHLTGWPNWRPEVGPLVRERVPGEAFGYSGEGYLYLQAVVERLVGKPLEGYMQEAVLDPLGMASCTFHWAAPGDPRVAQPHDREGRPCEPYIGERPEASSSLHTTPSDYARFLCALLRPSTVKGHLGAPQVAAMLQPQVRLNKDAVA